MAGRLEFLQVAQTLERLIEDPRARSSRGTLLIVQDSDAFASISGMKSILALVRHWAEHCGGQPCGIVAPTALALARAQATLPTLTLNVPQIRCFLSESGALGWFDEMASEVAAKESGTTLQPATADRLV